jgi:hypothetical protein
MLIKVSEVLDIGANEIKAAILQDHEETLNSYLKLGQTAEVKELHTNTEPTLTESQFSEASNFKMSSNS